MGFARKGSGISNEEAVAHTNEHISKLDAKQEERLNRLTDQINRLEELVNKLYSIHVGVDEKATVIASGVQMVLENQTNNQP